MFHVLWITFMGVLVPLFVIKSMARRAQGVPVFACKSRGERIYVIVMSAFTVVLLIALASD